MSSYRPAKVFASISNKPHSNSAKQSKKLENEETKQVTEKVVRENEIQVTASGDLCLRPDRCRVNIAISSSKENVQDVKNSVLRRLDYVVQTLHNQQVKDADITISKVLRKEDRYCYMDSVVTVVFVDVNKCQTVTNFLAEKLDETVKISFPEFFHSGPKLETLRKQACLKAVTNAKQKAQDIAKLLGHSLGRAIMVREEAVEEWDGAPDGTSPDSDGPMTIPQKMDQATVNVCAKVFACFEMKLKEKSKQAAVKT
ncbi:interleukin-1 receptor-associated kinase 1-binding protein 1 homolog [Lineus longissimus]|uniref:interleukin-1 receptor-associated kinase 1-binding protein 1 homolog n=1 Tax=Lineus longissimus TaxID=88925 RepID=UPI002B4E4BCE